MDNGSEGRPFPAAIFVQEDTIKRIVRQIAKLPENERSSNFLVVKSGRYRASTDQVVLYQHNGKVAPPKADLVSLRVCTVAQITVVERILLGSPRKANASDDLFLYFLRESWDDSLELDSAVTLLTCCNLKGMLLDYYVDLNKFHESLRRFSQE